MKKIFLLFTFCVIVTHAIGQSWQSSAPDILYGVNNILGTSPLRVGIGTSLPVAPLHIHNGCVLFEGNTGSTPVTGGGRRFMWIPDKAAFRAGQITGTGDHWDNANIGMWSGAGGVNTRSECEGCFAWGTGAFAVNDPMAGANEACISLGNGTTASGHVSIALGDQTIATGQAGATAIGVAAKATGLSSIAIGQNNEAAGNRSIVIGELANSTGLKSIAIGQDAWSTSESSLSLSTGEATASGKHSIAMGSKSNNNGHEGAFVYGDYDPSFTLPWVENTEDYQFMARARGGFVFHSDGNLLSNNALFFNDGKLGVGINVPTEKADINGKLKIRDIPQNNSLTQVLVNNGGVVNYRDVSTIADQDWLTLANATPTSINDDIYKNGRVGIGTNNPNAKFHILNPPCTNSPALRLSPTLGTFACGGGLKHGDLLVADDFNGNPQFVINPNGHTGIGGGASVNPQRFLLDLYRGDMLFKGNPSECAFSYRMHYQYWMPNGEFFISPTNFDGSLIPGVTGIAMGTNGNVGIGANSDPSNKLQIGGNIVPDANCTRDIGTATKRWNNIFLCNAPTITSDARLKENVRDIEYGLETIKHLRPVSYNLSSNPSSKRNLGLLAQETKEVIKEIVYVGDDTEKTHGIRYSELIPVLIKAVQELDKVLTERETKINELEERIKRLENAGGNNSNNTGINTNNNSNTDDLLYQNTPNPFNGITEIRYRIPQSYTNAGIMIFDMNGKKIKSIAVQGVEGSVSVSASEMAAGLYLYSLIIDGREIATKRMVVNK